MVSPAILLLACLAVFSAAEDGYFVIPPPQFIEASGSPVRLSPGFRFHLSDAAALLRSARLDAALGRYSAIVSRFFDAADSNQTTATEIAIDGLEIDVRSDDETLNGATRYDYTLSTDPVSARAVGSASTIYGAMYAMETFTQLVRVDGGRVVLVHSKIEVNDSPDYNWRGLMIDTGRRFFPVPLVQNLLDTMAAVKLNVLHLHASDNCRFSVESNVFPNLTDSLTGVLAGSYSQEDIKNLIEYAGARGIRVVPEFDVPGHSRGFLPIISNGIEFCTEDMQSQLFNDPQNNTLNVLTKLFTEMAGLFTDDVFHIGCDETTAVGPCTVNSTFALERSLLQFIQTALNKTPEGWEEVLFDAGAATLNTIVNAWANHNPAEIIATGRRAVNSAAQHFYLTLPGPAGPAGWTPCWYDISTGLNASQLPMLLGGEMSMWTDTYCYTDQCGAVSGGPTVAAILFSPEFDLAFSHSIGGMIFPRGFVGAAAFWNYNASVDPASPAFVEAIWQLNDQLAARGSYTCPSNCSCDQLTACGAPYIDPQPPQEGTPTYLQQCLEPVVDNQQWRLNADGTIALSSNASLCLVGARYQYPLSLGLCDNNASLVFKHPASAQLLTADNFCLDVDLASMQAGLYVCGSWSHLNQLNQEWAVDSTTGFVVSLYNGWCLTATSSPSFQADAGISSRSNPTAGVV